MGPHGSHVRSHASVFPESWRQIACLSGALVLLTGCGKTAVMPAAKLKAAPPSLQYTAPTPVPKLGPRRSLAAKPPERPRAAKSGIRRGGGYAKVGKPYRIGMRWYHPRLDPQYDKTGTASWYGKDFHGKKTANGEYFDMNRLSAAHPTLPLPSYVSVTNVANGRTLVVRVNDRGPYAHNRLIDLSRQTARYLGFEHHGTAKVRVRYVGKAPLDGNDHYEWTYLRRQPWSRTMVARR